MNRLLRWRNGRRPIASIAIYLVSAVIVAVYIIPLSLVLLTSVKAETESRVMDFSLPSEWHFDNYTTVLSVPGVGRGMINGLIMVVGVTALSVLVCSMAAFVIARSQRRFTVGAYQYLLAGMIAPFSFIPAIKVLQVFGLYGTYTGLILVDVGIQIPFITLLYVGFIQRLPREIDEAAIVDGAGPLRLFFQVILPLLKPTTMTCMVLLVTFAWNEFQNVLFLMPDQNKWTMPMTVFNFQGLHSYNYALVSANIVVSVIPVLLVYLFAQKHIVGGMVAGAVKS
ncbi:carbohydrate ABC transporter permease [Tessaracoccus sp. MC1865]|uniref:carbohydrate ABC transporter permease n=1 Tax=Tessaracoccus sp. MC1865 TaxID=2760310 RepID=UPI0016046BF8|nr:carbohydrate ABC transporter permease [Tessaracoccus sp. MC1865]MBB1482383.1 carbohydrate ABC transporter permease [Tessaracoccus sp. MC1865]QTO38153.1 carbohydrate ABC transporter permease [Tessaracoccus sp. MC1865]